MKKAVAIIVLIAVFCGISAQAEPDGYFILCNPNSRVNARISPGKRSSVVGWYECGDYVRTDGRTRNGFVHVVDVGLEVSDAWIYAGYLVTDKPIIARIGTTVISQGRVAVRQCIGGRRISWVKQDAEVTILARSDEWCVTSRGFIRTEYLGVN